MLVEKPSSHDSPPLQPLHNELCHGVRVQRFENTWRSSLQATFEKAQLKQWIFDQFLLISTVQEVYLSFHKCLWTALHWHHMNIWTKCVNEASQHNHLLIHVAAEPIKNCHTHTPEEIGGSPSIEWTPRYARPAPQTLCRNSHALLPEWKFFSECGGTYHWGWLTKSKPTMHNRDDYVQYGKIKPLTNTSSRDHVTSTFTWPAIRVNWDHSWWTSP